MSAIEQVIARARQGDIAFAERKQFKLARRRAIEKLRRFALADPYFYILELIQAAVANGAEYIDIACDEGDVLVSWVGGYLREDELTQLFDFLFASKERLDLAHVRSLALGVNALLLFLPGQVVIESGNGQPGGTVRMVVRAGAEQVDVGRAEGQFFGTYVRATKLNRLVVAQKTNRLGDEDGSLERRTIESRCLAAPVPLVFNGESLFGWSRQRAPNCYGYQRSLSFDEGDLYGSLGANPGAGTASFQLLTHGVWIQSYEHELIPKQSIGGVVCFDRLHKTVDHSGFVRDDRFEELWVRLRPYAEALVSGRPVARAQIASGDGLEYTSAELRALLAAQPRVVILAPKFLTDGEASWRANAIARLLDAQLLRAADEQVDAIRVLGDAKLRIWRPYLGDDREVELYNREPLATPPAPHLLPVVELEPPSLDALIEELAARLDGPMVLLTLIQAGLLDATAAAGTPEQRLARQLRVMLGVTGGVRASLYSPAEPGPAAHGLLVRVTTTDRLLGEQLFASAYPGKVLVVELPTAQPTALLRVELWRTIAECFAARALPVLRGQDERALAGLGVGTITAGSPTARMALQVLSRLTIARLRSTRPGADGQGGRLRPGLSFSLLRPVAGFDPLALPLLRTVSGKPLSLRALALLSDETAGLVYGTYRTSRHLEGLDPDRILAIDAISEGLLIGLLGESGYVRVDARDELARVGDVVVRDIAVGLRAYPDFPVLVEGAPEGGEALVGELVALLRRRMLGELDEPGDPRIAEEHRRQAVRHLQWIACRELARGGVEAIAPLGLDRLPLFVDLDGKVWALAELLDALRSREGLRVHYGHGLGAAELGTLTAAARAGQPSAAGRPRSLAVSAFGHRLLAPLGRVRLAFDFDLDDAEAGGRPASSSGAFLVEERWSTDAGTSVLGVPAQLLPEYQVQIRGPGRATVAALDELARRYGVVGTVELDEAAEPEAWLASLEDHASALLDRLLAALPQLADDPRRYAAALHALLSYLGEQLSAVVEGPNLIVQVATPLATRILGLPLFDLGGATLVSGQQLLQRFRSEYERRLFEAGDDPARVAAIDWGTIVASTTPAVARGWLDAHLQPAAVSLPASSPRPGASAEPAVPRQPQGDAERSPWDPREPLSPAALAHNLERWLGALRPDPYSLSSVWVVTTHELPEDDLIGGSLARMEVAWYHPLVQRLVAAPSPANLAWLLLAVYARINARSAVILNTHEAAFHLAVGHALVDGRLIVERPPG